MKTVRYLGEGSYSHKDMSGAVQENDTVEVEDAVADHMIKNVRDNDGKPLFELVKGKPVEEKKAGEGEGNTGETNTGGETTTTTGGGTPEKKK